MAAEPDEFEIHVVKNCPSDAPYFYLLRYGQKNEEIRFPPDRALQIRGPFEHPIGCKPGYWLIIYTSDRLGHQKVQHIGSKPHVEVRLSVPQTVREAADTEVSQEKLLDLLTTAPAEEEDDPDGSLKLTRIDAKKREVAIDLAAKEQKLLSHVNKNKELAEGFLLNRSHRLEVREQSEAMFRVQNQASAMVERTMVLVEKVQETIGRFAEIEKAAAQKLASPPPPPDYTPVLSSVVTAIRDIGVSAMQRDDRKKPKTDEDAPPVQATLADKPAGREELGAPAASVALAPTEKQSSAARPQPEPAIVAELKALVERAQAEREHLKSELEAERNRQRARDEVRPGRGHAQLRDRLPTATSPQDYRSARNSDAGYSEPSPPPHRTPRDAACPCGSGRRYRRCCLYKDRQAARKAQSQPPGSQLPPTPPPGSQLPPTPSPGSQLPPTQPQPLGSQLPLTQPQPPGSQLPPTQPQPPGSQLPPDRLASAASTQHPQTPAPTSPGSQLPPMDLPPGEVRPEVQELLVNILAGKMLSNADAPIPAPLVAQVKQVEEVLVSPPKMDPETARKLLNDGSTIEAFGAFLFFNPLLRTILLNRRGR